MRLKLALSNLKSHALISILIVLLMSCIYGVGLVGIECTNYLVQANISELKNQHHDFDITVKGDIPLSLRGISYYEDDGIHNISEKYQRIAAFYNITTVVFSPTSDEVANIYEADAEDFEVALNLKNIPSTTEALITSDLASKLSLKKHDYISIYVGTTSYDYQIIDIVEGEGIYHNSSVLIGGRRLNDYYGIKNVRMPNYILADLKDDNPEEVLDILRANYQGQTVTNLLDEEYAKTITTNSIGIIAIIVAILFVFILMLFLNVYLNIINKQKEVFLSLGQKRYYYQTNIISTVLAFIFAIILGSVFARIIFKMFGPIFSYDKTYIPSIVGRATASLLLALPFALLFLKKQIQTKNIALNNKQKIFCLIFISVIAMLLMFMNTVLKTYALFIVILITFALLLNLLIFLFKKVKKLDFRLYLYDLNVKDNIYKMQIYLQVFVITLLAVMLMSINVYKSQSEELSNVVKIECAVATSSEYLEISEYDRIRLASNSQIEEIEMSIVLGLDANQVSQYTTIVLTEKEQKLFNDDKYIILSKYFQNRYGYDIGDVVSMRVRGKEEYFKILKFTDNVFSKMAVVSNSTELYYGFVVEESKEALLNDFRMKNYQLINFSSAIDKSVSIFNSSIEVATVVMVILIILVILFAFYLVKIEIESKKEVIRKMKKLGLSRNEWVKINLIKYAFSIIVIVLFSLIMTYFIMSNIDTMLRLVKGIIYCKYNLNIAIVSIVIGVLSAILSSFYVLVLYKKTL